MINQKINQFNSKGEKEGYWAEEKEIYSSIFRIEKGIYKNGKREGEWLEYDRNEKLHSKSNL